MIHECTIIKCQIETIHSVFHTKPSLRLQVDQDYKQLMVIHTANRPSHEREKHTKIIITNQFVP